jgi:hypothetical protein
MNSWEIHIKTLKVLQTRDIMGMMFGLMKEGIFIISVCTLVIS